jgi:hypothetical protein
MLNSISNFIKRFSTGNKKMETKKVIFVVEANVSGERQKEIIKKIRAVRSAVKIGVNSIEGVKATRIANKDK